jgi:acetyl esterase/lipase
VLIPIPLIAVALLIGLGISSVSAVQATNNSSVQNNIGISSASQPSSSSDNASDYFVLQSQQELINAVNAGRAEEMFAKIGQAASEIKMASITDYNIITGTDGNNNNTIQVRFYDPGIESKPAPLLIYLYGRAGEEINMDFFDTGLRILANSTGFMVATMDYRFAPFSDSLDDVVSTVRWIRQNSEQLGVDPQRIALGGESRGANLALSFSLYFFSLFSHDFKCFIPKDSNIAGFTICADWDKASRTYEISILFTYAASIVCTSPFRGCW